MRIIIKILLYIAGFIFGFIVNSIVTNYERDKYVQRVIASIEDDATSHEMIEINVDKQLMEKKLRAKLRKEAKSNISKYTDLDEFIENNK